jgi:hypothetical protein
MTPGCAADDLHKPFLPLPADDQPDAVNSLEFIGGPLRVASDGRHEAAGIASMSRPQKLAALAISDVGYRARIEHVDVGTIGGAQPEACVNKPASE